MNLRTLSVCLLISLAIWVGLIQVIDHFFVVNWALVGKFAVVLVIVAIIASLVRTVMLMGRASVEFERAMRREAESYDYDEYEQPHPPRAA
jgi:uncharacterized membrane protein YcjF (UPF0283 family)